MIVIEQGLLFFMSFCLFVCLFIHSLGWLIACLLTCRNIIANPYHAYLKESKNLYLQPCLRIAFTGLICICKSLYSQMMRLLHSRVISSCTIRPCFISINYGIIMFTTMTLKRNMFWECSLSLRLVYYRCKDRCLTCVIRVNNVS